MKTARLPLRATALCACVVLLLALAVTAAAPALPASSLTDRALAAATRIHITLAWPGKDPIDVYGSGWTRSCNPTGQGWTIVIATAAHVIDIDELERELGSGKRATVTVAVEYRDGVALKAGREALRVDRAHDYGEVRLPSSTPRQVLPAGAPGDVRLGDSLFTVACPGGIRFGFFSGHLILRAPIPVNGAPSDSWLTSVQVGPGASGGPVVDADGRVVATVIGLITWRWGGTASVVAPIPDAGGQP